MPLVICPNCKKEFIVKDEVIGKCPNCNLSLIFKGKDEVIEKINIKEIERKIDEITEEEAEISLTDKILIDSIGLEEIILKIEKEVDKL